MPRPRYITRLRQDRLRSTSRLSAYLAAQADRLGITAAATLALLRRPGSYISIGASSAPANTAAPAITGTAQVGQTLTRSLGTWNGAPAPTFTTQWLRGGVAISGATGQTYVLQPADQGAVITVTVTATNQVRAVSATSAATSAVAAA